MARSLKPHRALLHPLWLAALTLLALNDHFLKGSGLFPGWLTGKLSDAAGLLVAPALLAALLQLSSRRALALAHLATGLVFSAIKLSPAAAQLVERLIELGPFHATIVVDPTDLLALPALALSFTVLGRTMALPVPERPLTQRALLIAGALSCAATSQRNPCLDDPNACQPEPQTPRQTAALVLGNTTSAERLVRVRALKSSVVADCDRMLIDPTETLSRELFDNAITWLIEPKRGLPLLGRPGCSAYLVDADGMEMTLLAWRESEFPNQELSTSTDEPDVGRMIGIQLSSTTGKLMLGTHSAVYAAPPLEPAAASAECALPELSVGVDWSIPLVPGGVIQAIASSPDGCHAMTLENDGEQMVFYLCVPGDAMPFAEGDLITIDPITPTAAFPEAGGHGTLGVGIAIRSESTTLLAFRGNVVAHRSMDPKAESIGEPMTDAESAAGCLGSHDACGNLGVPVELSLAGSHVPDTIAFLRAGQSLELGEGYGTLHLIRAEERPIRDVDCPPASSEERHFDSVLVFAPGAQL
jgi:hypothetical protein